MDNVEGYELPVRRALTEKVLWCGVPRELLLLNIVVSAFLLVMFHYYQFLAISIVVHFIFVIFSKKDPMFFDVFIRYQRTEKFYWP